MQDLIIKVKTDIVSNNLPAFSKEIKSQLAEINTELKTDNDFAEAEDFVKSLKKAEDELKEAKERIFETGDLSEINATINELSELCREKRLDLNKQVKQRKEDIKSEMVTKSIFAVNEAAKDLKYAKFIEAVPRSEYENQLKSKRTIQSMQDALDRFVGITITDLTDKNKQMSERAELIKTLIKGNESLFNFDSLMTNENAPQFITERIEAHEKQVKEAAEAKAKELAEQQAKKEQAESVNEQLSQQVAPASTMAPSKPDIEPVNDEPVFNYSITLSITCGHSKAVSIARALADDHGRENVKLAKLGEVA